LASTWGVAAEVEDLGDLGLPEIKFTRGKPEAVDEGTLANLLAYYRLRHFWKLNRQQFIERIAERRGFLRTNGYSVGVIASAGTAEKYLKMAEAKARVDDSFVFLVDFFEHELLKTIRSGTQTTRVR
jgi:hypothetical protein